MIHKPASCSLVVLVLLTNGAAFQQTSLPRFKNSTPCYTGDKTPVAVSPFGQATGQIATIYCVPFASRGDFPILAIELGTAGPICIRRRETPANSQEKAATDHRKRVQQAYSDHRSCSGDGKTCENSKFQCKHPR